MFKSELEFEDRLVELLVQYGWPEVINHPDEDYLIQNWANIIYENNRSIDRLGNHPLTRTEMEQIIEQINILKTPAKLNEFINGGYVSIKRDNEFDKLHFGKEVSLKIFDKDVIAGGDSVYQIVKQPKFKGKTETHTSRRGDLMLLINGMPVIHIELKRSGVDISQAYNQIRTYHSENVFTGLFSLVQIFVAMTPENTLYFSNPGHYKNFNKDYYFTWSDRYNEPIKDWKEIASRLLSIPMAHTLIGYYTIADDTDGILKVMRSYQYYAAREIANKISLTNWGKPNQFGGYIWHTTGSGKTLTSFKSAQLIANSKDADKVVFLVDRIELATQSLQQYRNFSNEAEEVQATENTNILINKLKSRDPGDTLIVTSIQKMSRIRQEYDMNQNEIDLINKKRIVFIIDEAHRSTFGEMLQSIRINFPRAILFGFTGTPIHEENKKFNSTTASIFGNELHRYSIADGIRDENVLGFDPYKVVTFRDKDLKENIILEKTKSSNITEVFQSEEKLEIYNKYNNMPMAGIKNDDGTYSKGIEDFIKTEQYQTKEHQEAVVSNIIEDFPKLSSNGKFHAIFATSSIKEAIEYYQHFKNKEPNIKVAGLFDPSDQNNETSIDKIDGLVEMLDDYNKMFGQRFSISTYDQYKKDISLRLSHKEYYRNIDEDKSKTLDILIVVNQMLTGFDSKWVNTLYLDKVLRFENIVQSFSRTNRLFGKDKPFGIIKYYRKPHTMEKNIEEAFESYSGNKTYGIFVYKLAENLKSLNEIYDELRHLFKVDEIYNFEKLPNDDESKKKFSSLFRELNEYLDSAKIQGFHWEKKNYKFPEHNSEVEVRIEEKEYLALSLRYKELFKRNSFTDNVSIPYEIDSYLMEINTESIDNDYMNSRFVKYINVLNSNDNNKVEIEATLKELHKTFATLSQDEQKYANIFLYDVQNNKISVNLTKSFRDYIVEYRTKAIDDGLEKFAYRYGLNNKKLKLFIKEVNPKSLNEFGRVDKLLEGTNYEKARETLDKETNTKHTKFTTQMKVKQLINKLVEDEGVYEE